MESNDSPEIPDWGGGGDIRHPRPSFGGASMGNCDIVTFVVHGIITPMNVGTYDTFVRKLLGCDVCGCT